MMTFKPPHVELEIESTLGSGTESIKEIDVQGLWTIIIHFLTIALSDTEVETLKTFAYSERIVTRGESEEPKVVFLKTIEQKSSKQILVILQYLCNKEENEAIRDKIKEVINKNKNLRYFREQFDNSDPNDNSGHNSRLLSETLVSRSNTTTIKLRKIWRENKTLFIIIFAIMLMSAIITIVVITPVFTTGNEGTTPQTPQNETSVLGSGIRSGSGKLDIVPTVTPFTHIPRNGNRTKRPPRREKPTPTLLRSIDREKNDIRNWKHAFHIPSMTTYTLDTVRDLALNRRGICSSNSRIALIINQSKEFNDKDLSLSCNPEGVKALNLSGYMSPLNLATILRTLPNITYLHLNLQGICDFVDDHLSSVTKVENMGTIVLDSLKYLKLTNVTKECMVPLRLVEKMIIADNLTILSLSKFNVQITNSELVEETVLSFESIRDFSFSGKLCPNCNLFMDNAAANWTSKGLHGLDFHVENESGFDSGAKSVVNLLDVFGNDLKYLNSNVPITKRDLSGSGKNLLFLNATISVPNGRNQFSAKFFDGFPKLRESHLGFKFETVEEGQNLVITNLIKYIDKRRQIDPFVLSATKDVNLKPYKKGQWKLSCRNWSMETISNIVTYVWKYNGCTG